MSWVRINRAAAAAAALAVASPAGCARYVPSPLGSAADRALSAPDHAALTAQAAGLRHPLLRPVTIDFARPLTPDAVAVLAVVSSPDLKAARAKAGVADAQLFSAGLLPDPTINLAYDQLLRGPDAYNAYAAQFTYDLIALRDRRVVVAGERASRDQVRLDLAWQEWQTAGQARLLAARIAGLSQAARLDADSRRSADAALSRGLTAAARGDVKADEVEARRLAAADAVDKLGQAQRDLAAARSDLNKLIGLPPSTALAIALPKPSPEATESDEALFQRARTERLDLRALERGYDSQEAGVRKAVMDQFPALQLTVNRAQDTANNQTIGPAINFTLPLWNRNRGVIRLAEATREQLRAEYAARLVATRADISALARGLALARRQRREIAALVAPFAGLVRATAAAARRGDVARATAETAEQSLRDKRLSLVALDQAIAEQSASLELAVGGPLQGAAS